MRNPRKHAGMEKSMENQSIRELLPTAYIESIKRILPRQEQEPFLAIYEKPALHGLRINPLKCGEKAPDGPVSGLEPVPWCKTGFYYEEALRPGKHVYHDAGVYYIQEPSAMLTAELADVRPGERVLDLCAAPGGKSTQLAGKLQGEGLLVANEIHAGRAAILSQNLERMGVRNGVVTNHAPEELVPHFPHFFDTIVVDAPCSGEGMFRKNPEAIAEWSPETVKMCAKRQQVILEQAVKMLRPGGKIIYSTCTFAPEEDEIAVREFLDHNPEFSLSHQQKLWPHREKGEGHFAAVLQHDPSAQGRETAGLRNADEEPPDRISENEKRKPKGKPDGSKAALSKQQKAQYLELVKSLLTGEIWRQEKTMERLIRFGEQIYLLPPEMPSLSGMRVLRPGLQIAVMKKDRLEPAHALAMACRPEEAAQRRELETEQEALAYQMGHTVPCEKNGWVLVCFHGYSLGWGKASGGICKNHYPKGLRRVN